MYDTQNHWVLGFRLALSKGPNRVPPPHRRTVWDPVSETLCSQMFSVYRTTDKIYEPSNSENNINSREIYYTV
jgi:hypothetical protein